ncbi:glycosyltransferase [Candidatus Microgenomates bacterium]|nr:glycosyltransferase [Candidatus Microgenomates bacterium]
MISVVVPCFNSGKGLVENLQKLQIMLRETGLEWEIIVVDDASTDDSAARIKESGLRVKVLQNDKNRGFGVTVDAGIGVAKGEIVFILNATDILPENSDYFKKMIAHFKNVKVFAVAALKKEDEDHGCGRIYFEKGFFLHGPAVGNKFSAWADGGAEAVRREYYLKIGGFDPLYKFYWEDVDLGYRAWKAGYEVFFDPKAVLVHEKAAGPIAKVYSERQRRVMNYRNQMVFSYKNADLKHLVLHCVWWPYHLAVALKNLDGDYFVALWQAVLCWPQILAARARQKGVTKLSDDQVLLFFQK